MLFAASMHVAMAVPNCHFLEVMQGDMPMKMRPLVSWSDPCGQRARFLPRVDSPTCAGRVRWCVTSRCGVHTVNAYRL